MTRILAALALACMAALASPAVAETACPQHYFDGRAPAVDPARSGVIELCQRAFATLYDPDRRDPVYAAEALTSASVTAAARERRADDFRPDERLPPGQRAILRDYRGQRTYDRGHLAPAHDMPDATADSESFRLSNMVPQAKANNRGPWAQIEEAARTLAVPRLSGGKVYVVSGPIFVGPVRRLKGRVAIPTRLFKAVYAEADDLHNERVVGAWIVDNAAALNARFVSLDTLKAETGIDPFPGLPADLRGLAELPTGARKRTGV